jgi:hypothetical protein
VRARELLRARGVRLGHDDARSRVPGREQAADEAAGHLAAADERNQFRHGSGSGRGKRNGRL